MVACPTCQDTVSVEVARDQQPWEDDTDGPRARWQARCTACGASWILLDRV